MPGHAANSGAKRAREARRELGLGDEGPLEDILKVIEKRGGAHVLLLDLPEDLAGAFIKRPDLPLLIVRGKDFIGRQRFTLAHEFGHCWMGHEGGVDKQENIGRASTNPHETMANAFASEFLVPKRAIQTWGGRRLRRKVTLEDVLRLACEYGVSAPMMRIRLETCGVLRDEKLAKRLDSEIEEGLHSALKAHLGLSYRSDSLAKAADSLPRIPKAIRRSALGDLLAGRTDIAELAERNGFAVEQLEEMVATMGLGQLLPEAR